MIELKNLLKIKHKKNSLIICSGSSINDKLENIEKFIIENRDDLDIFGINNIHPELRKYIDYHCFTNTQRFKTYSKNIDLKNIKLLLGKNININLKNKVLYGFKDYYNIDYSDIEGKKIEYSNGKINGFFRTCGCLTIYISHLMKHKNIYIIGMDGYTLFNEDTLNSNLKSQHWYGKGLTDTADYKTCCKKDKLIYTVLDNLKSLNINFKILTETVYQKYLNLSILN
jgi:hypothetical protein